MADYPIPPWLNPQTDWGALAMRRSALKAQVQESAARLAQQSQQFQQEQEMKRMALEAQQKVQEQELQQQAEIAKHKLAIEQAYNTAKLSIDAQQLQQQSQKIDLAYAQEAQKQAGIQAFESGVEERFKQTGDLPGAFQEGVMRRGASAGLPGSAYSATRAAATAADKANLKPEPWQVKLPSGDTMEGVTMGGTMRVNQPQGAQGFPETTVNEGPNGLLFVNPQGGKSTRVMQAPKFKFSKAAELKELSTGTYKDYISGVKKVSSISSKEIREEVQGAIDKYQKLVAEMAAELDEFTTGGRGSGIPNTSTNRFRYNPQTKTFGK